MSPRPTSVCLSRRLGSLVTQSLFVRAVATGLSLSMAIDTHVYTCMEPQLIRNV